MSTPPAGLWYGSPSICTCFVYCPVKLFMTADDNFKLSFLCNIA